MTIWNELTRYIGRNYRYEEVGHDVIRLLLSADGDRSQLVYVRYGQTSGGQEWVVLESPIGKVSEIDVHAILPQVEKYVCGGLAQYGEMLTFRHAVLLDGMDVNEFETPLHSISDLADRFESTVSLEDAH